MDRSELPVAVIGAGPVGLAAAAHLLEQGQEPIVFEAGPYVGTSLRSWGHVRLFSPWRYVIDDAARRLLDQTTWTAPDPERYPTGGEIVDQYLDPLAATPALRSRIRTGQQVTSVVRSGFDKMTTPGRVDAPFAITVQTGNGDEETVLVKAVVDASGTSNRPNPAGAAGVKAIGEQSVADRIVYGIPDVLGGQRSRYAGKRVLVLGSGHSAFNALLDLVDLADRAPGTSMTWAVRNRPIASQNLFGGGIEDALPARGELGVRVRNLIESGRLQFVPGFRTMRMTATPDGIVVGGTDIVLPPVDEIIVATGLRPDLSFLSEVRLSLDSVVESPTALAPLIDPNVHSCGSVPPHGAREAPASGNGSLHRRHEELRSGPNLPDADRLRAGAFGCGGNCRRLGCCQSTFGWSCRRPASAPPASWPSGVSPVAAQKSQRTAETHRAVIRRRPRHRVLVADPLFHS